MATLNSFAFDSADTKEHPLLSEMYDQGEYIDVCFTASGHPEKCDYGVPRSPVWYEMANIVIQEFEVNGKTMCYNEVKRLFGIEAAEYLHAVCVDVAEEKELLEWEE
jgi:hypothetical protein